VTVFRKFSHYVISTYIYSKFEVHWPNHVIFVFFLLCNFDRKWTTLHCLFRIRPIMFVHLLMRGMSKIFACHLVIIIIFSSFMTYHRVCDWSNTTGATSGAVSAYPSGAPEFTPVFVARSLLLYVMYMFCRSLFVLFHLVIVVSICFWTIKWVFENK